MVLTRLPSGLEFQQSPTLVLARILVGGNGLIMYLRKEAGGKCFSSTFQPSWDVNAKITTVRLRYLFHGSVNPGKTSDWDRGTNSTRSGYTLTLWDEDAQNFVTTLTEGKWPISFTTGVERVLLRKYYSPNILHTFV